jgi:hypothetical protein
LRHFFKPAAQDVPRDLINLSETQHDRLALLIVRVVDRYAQHIAEIEITQRIFK